MRAHVHIVTGNSGLPLALIGQAIPKLSRHDLEALAERLIDHLDGQDGDADLEEDDPAGQQDEDGINTGQFEVWKHGRRDAGPGCPISDPGEDGRQREGESL